MTASERAAGELVADVDTLVGVIRRNNNWWLSQYEVRELALAVVAAGFGRIDAAMREIAAAERRGAERALLDAANWLAANDNARPEYDEVQAAFEDPELWLRVRAEEIGTS